MKCSGSESRLIVIIMGGAHIVRTEKMQQGSYVHQVLSGVEVLMLNHFSLVLMLNHFSLVCGQKGDH